ncbi:MAG: response regulator [Candidatus Latescibacteria bacterium]|nr:response regulator [Candidatus Latescibacterota bacterium]
MLVKILQILNEPADLRESVRGIVEVLQQEVGFDAVGIRLEGGEEEGDFPYWAQEGFTREFLLAANSLVERTSDGATCRDKNGKVCLECTCGLVISGKTNPAHPLFTPGGSFWTNDSPQLLSILPEQEPRHNPRNECIHHGYNSIALVPIQSRGRIVGLIQLNDRRKGRLTLEMVEQIEQLAALIGEALRRKQAEDALRESEFFFRESQRAAAIGSYGTDFITGRWKSSEVLDAIFGIDAAYDRTIEGWLDLVHAEDQEMMRQYLAEEVIGQGKPFAKEYRITRRSDGETRWVNGLGEVKFDGSGKLVSLIGTIQDITERKHTEQELVRIQRLRAVGELSAGVCHNLNNLLTGVLVPAEMVQMASTDAKIQRLAGTIIEVGTRAAELVHRLHLSVRGTSSETLVPVGLNPVIDGAVQMSRPRWKDEPEAKGLVIEVRTELAEVPPVMGTPSELNDLMINLVFNAVDAMPEGGQITIRTVLEGQFVRLEFRDSGTGMDEETRLRIFEPFFTTKQHIGTGLGLATLYNSVTQWGGSVQVESAPGKGTTFILRLPIWKQKDEMAPASTPAIGSRPGRVLIVEDEEALGRALKEVLSPRHEVEIFSDGQVALEQFRAGTYDVAILDLGLPGLSGDRLAQRIQELDPAVGRILFTGWELEADDPRRRVFDLALQKPLRSLRDFEYHVAEAIQLHDRRNAG